MKTWLIVSTLVVATGTLLYVQDRRQRSAAEQARADITALSASVAELRAKRSAGDPARLRGDRRASVDTPEERAKAASLSEVPADRDGRRRRPLGDERPPGPSPEEIATHHESTFREQPTDRAWAQPAEGRISTGMHQLLQNPAKLISVECRESLCRMEASLGSAEESDQILRRMVEEEGIWSGAISYHRTTDTDGNVKVTAYLVREGYARPMPDRAL